MTKQSYLKKRERERESQGEKCSKRENRLCKDPEVTTPLCLPYIYHKD